MVGQVEPNAQPQGTLDATALPSLLSMLADEGRTGRLSIDGGSEVWLSSGLTYLAVTASSPELAKVLFDSDVAAPDAIAAALQEAAPSSSSTVFDQLLAANPQAEEPLRRLLHEYNLNALFEMLVPTNAAFQFEPDLRHPIGPRFAQDTVGLVDKAQRRVEIWRRIAARIPSTLAVFVMAPNLPAQTEERAVTADEWRFLACLDGRHTVADVIADTGESAFRVCSSLYRLLLEDLIEEATR